MMIYILFCAPAFQLVKTRPRCPCVHDRFMAEPLEVRREQVVQASSISMREWVYNDPRSLIYPLSTNLDAFQEVPNRREIR